MKKFDVFRCPDCGAQFETVNGCSAAGCVPECCGKAMRLQRANDVEAAVEKHVPVVEKHPDGILVKVGSVTHPMEEKHFIEWIEVISGNRTWHCFLNPGDAPEAVFCVPFESEYKVRISCNIHGLWKNAAK